ncbi:very short patch repair endonuclease [Mycobacterium dioxanotrophicus]|uniref:Very short patch repair endonuclease n=2 Tax=Mycobacterium dioxanotrophicus TaxID=482462 RepID=A0A1Y0BZL5_9MYCO|nr:very short patch repair endonuclease [Mycobacterium dioxanotrophicus]
MMSVESSGQCSGRRPPASSEIVRSRMSRQRRRDTQPELLVRRILHSRGIRYRVDGNPEADLRCKADILWRQLHMAVFIDGCFWHGCPDHATRPKANEQWWAHKLDGNIRRDRRMDAELAARGWKVLRFWEHEDPVAVADAICAQLVALRDGYR